MKTIECEQGSYEWFLARLGRPSASRFADIVTATGKAARGVTPRKYALELLGERLTQEPAQHFTTSAMERGQALEPAARKWYAFATGRAVKQVGFITDDDGTCGCSPDGLCEDRGIEIKCPMLPTFLDIAECGALPDEHMMQVQGGMWITGLTRWDYVLYTDARGIQPLIIEVLPDSAIHAAFTEIIPRFCHWLAEMETKMRAAGHGYTPEPENLPTWAELVGG